MSISIMIDMHWKQHESNVKNESQAPYIEFNHFFILDERPMWNRRTNSLYCAAFAFTRMWEYLQSDESINPQWVLPSDDPEACCWNHTCCSAPSRDLEITPPRLHFYWTKGWVLKEFTKQFLRCKIEWQFRYEVDRFVNCELSRKREKRKDSSLLACLIFER